MKEYLFFSKTDRRNIITLCVIIILLAVSRIIISNYKTKKEFLKYSQAAALMVADSIKPENENVAIIAKDNTEQINDKMPTQQIKHNETKILNTGTNEQKPIIKEKAISVIELNSADSVGLLPLPGIGPVFAGRIIHYRERLGGFYCKEQLLEIKYFTNEMLEKLSDNIIIDALKIKKLAVNKLEFREILRHPYIDYEMTKIIANERDKMRFTSTEDFVTRTGIGDTLLLRYLEY